ncbi:MAG: hypothetical protein AAF583_01625 [Pseudomonadota bacterium]
MRVKAKQVGEYPLGTWREPDEIFEWEPDKDNKEPPSWTEKVSGGGSQKRSKAAAEEPSSED